MAPSFKRIFMLYSRYKKKKEEAQKKEEPKKEEAPKKEEKKGKK